MPMAKCSRFCLLGVNMIAAFLAIGLAITAIWHFVVPDPQLKQCQKEVKQIQSRLRVYEDVRREGMAKIRHLVESHELLDAALLLEDIAATERMLVGSIKKREVPSAHEEEALMYMKKAGYGEIFTDYLQLRYPGWGEQGVSVPENLPTILQDHQTPNVPAP